jgi:hypothetical protein
MCESVIIAFLNAEPCDVISKVVGRTANNADSLFLKFKLVGKIRTLFNTLVGIVLPIQRRGARTHTNTKICCVVRVERIQTRSLTFV